MKTQTLFFLLFISLIFSCNNEGEMEEGHEIQEEVILEGIDDSTFFHEDSFSMFSIDIPNRMKLMDDWK